MDNDDRTEALGQGLEFQVTAPFAIFPHTLDILIDRAVLILVNEVSKELFIV